MAEYAPLLITLGTILALMVVFEFLTYLQRKEGYTPMNWKDFGHVVEQIAPIALALTGVPPAFIPVAVNGIKIAEAIPGAKGADKKAAVLAEVNTAIQATNIVHPGAVDPAVINVVSNGIDAALGAVNAVHKQPIDVDADLPANLNPPPSA